MDISISYKFIWHGFQVNAITIMEKLLRKLDFIVFLSHMTIWTFIKRPGRNDCVISWGRMTSHVMDLTCSGQFNIIIYLKIDLSLIIRNLIYLTLLVNFSDQPFKSTYAINFLIKSAVLLPCGMTFPQQTYVRKKVYF